MESASTAAFSARDGLGQPHVAFLISTYDLQLVGLEVRATADCFSRSRLDVDRHLSFESRSMTVSFFLAITASLGCAQLGHRSSCVHARDALGRVVERVCAQADVWQRLSWLSRPRSVCLTSRCT